ncbi:hypothetical protein [Terracoccus luteus]|uniref:Uncharacterized protein n=1 Tax=Terracoccus luteus TaxID=53356 RepID=A0A839Q720_9MICO|nr:hypothetical protein [Terracoccus luteus]MBB2988441.1 hypothetical protein [Terracoccus luteus]MCP2174104.1 hypothetical protein [Terracoccus luteus]
MNYRVMVKADRSSCLERADGTKLRCGKVTGTAGFGPGVALADDAKTGTTPAGTSVAIPANADLSKLSDAQLVTREMLARMKK